MKKILIYCLILLIIFAFKTDSFKNEQLKYSRVRNAYANKESFITQSLAKHGIKTNELHMYMRVFKHEKIVELWGKNRIDKTYKLIKQYNICNSSGTLGPKRKQGDYQVPEGFYHINAFNPWSSYHLSMMVNYPNKSDRILGYKPNLGGQICIHGSCVTIGCIPLTDDLIEEVYIYCIEAKNNGQTNIPVSIFPCKMNTKTLNSIKSKKAWSKETLGLWDDLEKAYTVFNTNKSLPSIGFLANGRHTISK